MLVVDKVHELRRVGLAQEIERSNLQAGGKAIENFHRLFRSQGLLQHILRIFQTTRGNVVAGHSHLIKFTDYLCLYLGADLFLVRNFEGYTLNFIIVQMLKKLR